MSKTQATRKAKAQLRYGYFSPRAGEGWVRCPDCQEHVETRWWVGDSRHPAKILEQGLTEHLVSGCAA